MQKISIEMEMDEKFENGKVMILLNGIVLTKIESFNLEFSQKSGEMKFNGVRLKTNERGQYFVDETTKDTAKEEINLLNFFVPQFQNKEFVIDVQKGIEDDLCNVRDTSYLNAKKLIKEELSTKKSKILDEIDYGVEIWT